MISAKQTSGPYTDSEIVSRVGGCPLLGSLRSISTALSSLVRAEGGYIHEIAEVIRKDPTLTTRLLKLVNSVFFGLSHRVTNIEDAIFYLGIRQVRELALATPVIEDFAAISNKELSVDWGNFWRHSIGCAIVTRELISVVNISSLDETDYIMGLVNDVGKLIMASVFPEEFRQVQETHFSSLDEIYNLEKSLIGWDHGRLGALYLKKHELPTHVVEAVAYHNNPGAAPTHSKMSAILQVADYMVRFVGVESIEKLDYEFKDNCWRDLPAWKILFPKENSEDMFGIASLRHSLERLPELLKGMVDGGG